MLIVLYDRLDISVHLIFCSLYAYVCIYRVGQKVKPIFLRAQRYASAVLTMALSRRLSLTSPSSIEPAGRIGALGAVFTARRNARIASAVLAIAIPSVCLSVRPSVRHTPVLCQNDGT